MDLTTASTETGQFNWLTFPQNSLD